MSRPIMAPTRLRSSHTDIPGWVVFLVIIALSLGGCGSYPGGDAGGSVQTLPAPGNNLLGRIFILGTQKDQPTGDLRIFVTGTDNAGNPLQLDDFQNATVSIDGSPADPGLWSVAPIAAGDDVLSLGFVTDYSSSISDAELGIVADIYSLIVDNLSPPKLPAVMEGMSIIFSNIWELKQDWTENSTLLKDAFQLDDLFPRENTAFYDALGVALKGDPARNFVGLVERCRPAHMLITYTDGKENTSLTYTKEMLLPIIQDSEAVMIMLGNKYADKDILIELAGDQGAFVYAYDLTSIQNVVEKWANSLSDMVKFTLDQDTGWEQGIITIKLPGEEAVVVERPVDGFCEIQP